MLTGLLYVVMLSKLEKLHNFFPKRPFTEKVQVQLITLMMAALHLAYGPAIMHECSLGHLNGVEPSFMPKPPLKTEICNI